MCRFATGASQASIGLAVVLKSSWRINAGYEQRAEAETGLPSSRCRRVGTCVSLNARIDLWARCLSIRTKDGACMELFGVLGEFVERPELELQVRCGAGCVTTAASRRRQHPSFHHHHHAHAHAHRSQSCSCITPLRQSAPNTNTHLHPSTHAHSSLIPSWAASISPTTTAMLPSTPRAYLYPRRLAQEPPSSVVSLMAEL